MCILDVNIIVNLCLCLCSVFLLRRSRNPRSVGMKSNLEPEGHQRTTFPDQR